MSLRSDQHGDTLIEVALAMAILGAVIAAAFAISNRAIRLSTDAKERVYAANLQQYQAEALRSLHDNLTWDPDFINGPQAFNAGVPVVSGPPKTDYATPCSNDPNDLDKIPPGSRFYISRSSSGLWKINNGTLTDGIFLGCVVRHWPDPDSSHMRFDIFVQWPSQGSKVVNKSVLTTYQINNPTISGGP